MTISGSSPGHSDLQASAGAGLVEGGLNAVNWGGLDGLHPHLNSDPDRATAAADAAIKAERKLEHVYYQGMANLLEVTDMRERISRRELYRRCSHIGEVLIDVAERIVYAVVKES